MKNNIFKAIYALLGLGLLGAVVTAIVIISFSFSLPKINSLNDYRPPIPSQILAKDGTVLANIGLEDRVVAEIDEIPERIIGAFLSAEDDKFYEHQGVDYLGVARAMLANIKAGRVVQGGSTITQQVAKSLLLTSERSISRKIKDFLLALRIEKHLSKDEILYLYLNQVYLGGGYYGVKAAFKGYYNKELNEATVAESAMVAGLLVAPGRYSPYMSTQAAIRRQHYVLGRMHATGKIDEEEYKAALAEKIKFRIRKPSGFKAGYFTDWIRQRVVEAVGEEEFLVNGFVVETTLDWPLQEIAEREIEDGARVIDKRQGFKGPLRHLEKEKWEEFFKKKREEIYADASTYFTIDDELMRINEFVLDESIWEKINEYETNFNASSAAKRLVPGYYPEDPVIPILKKSSLHEAIVIETDDWARVVYVKVAGVMGIIPYEMFRWAHERVISPDRVFYPYITKPSTILKSGDIIQVKIMADKTGLYSRATDEFKKFIDKLKDSKSINAQKYLLCMLEQDPDAEAALVSLNPYNGEIISLVGGTNFSKSQFNRALQALRQPGSSFKPMLYAAALENGFTPATTIIDSPEALAGVEGLNWKPRNYDGAFKGPMTLRRALEVSRNVPTIKIAQDLGVNKIHMFSQRIGVNSEMPKDLSVALGSFGITLLNLTATYGIFPNGGKKLTPKAIVSITDRDGKRYFLQNMISPLDGVEENIEMAEEAGANTVADDLTNNEKPEAISDKESNQFLASLVGDQVYDSRLAYVMTNILRGVVLYGTGRGAKEVSTFLGGKTGTTNNYVDAWFMGFSSNLVTGVWTGFDNNDTLGFGETGARSALPIWKEFMRAGLKRYGENDFRAPPGVVNVVIDKETGRVSRSGMPNSFIESFAEGTEPGAVDEIKNETAVPDTGGPIFEEDEYFNNQ